VKATHIQTVVFDAKYNSENALYRWPPSRSSTRSWAQFRAHLSHFSSRCVQEAEGKRGKATVSLTVASSVEQWAKATVQRLTIRPVQSLRAAGILSAMDCGSVEPATA